MPVDLVKPDLPSTDLVPPGYFTYPHNPAKAITEKPAAALDQISMTYISYVPAPRDATSNRWWSRLEDGLGTKVDLQPISSADYNTKFQAMIAGGQLPDIVNFPVGTPDKPRVFEKLFADLGPLLSGDAAKNYPYLANIPHPSWKWTVSNGTVYAVPQHRVLTGGGIFYRAELFDRLGLSAEPANGDELVELMKSLTDARENRWAFSNASNIQRLLVAMMGGPNGWQETDGKFSSAYDHPAFREALLKTAEIIKAGLAHPNSVSATYSQHREMFYAGSTGLLLDGPAGWDLYVRSLPPDARLALLVAPKWGGGGDSPQFGGTGIQSITAVNKQLTGDKLEAAVGVLNYLAAPIGSAEHLERKFGAEGTDFTWIDDRPELTESGNKNFLDFQYIVDSPIVLGPGPKDQITTLYQWNERMAKSVVLSPTTGLYSATAVRKSATLERALQDVVTGVMFERNSISDFDAALKKWHADGGDQVAQEYGEAFAVSQ